jgi:hypothetical protein
MVGYTTTCSVAVALVLFLSVAQGQKWTGTFAWDSQCQPRSCCCYSGTLTVVRSGSNLVFSSDTRGCSSSRSSSTVRDPNSYSFSTTGVRGAPIAYQLSSDSNSLTVRNQVNTLCTSNGRRTSTGTNIRPSLNIFILFCIVPWLFLSTGLWLFSSH